ncbi:exo-beta-N-acetylmuramidase NamZ domain-containing protein [Flavobacterium sp. RHBU_3]|uniref:exo-beta-N-acetylmuramidase NamZ family protein n=1 Tax=Flavobacterium sp. RHBU_3 TaxID=3391184 RepID=UPI0039852429
MVYNPSVFRKALVAAVKNTVLFLFILITACGNSAAVTSANTTTIETENPEPGKKGINTGADRSWLYLPLLRNKRVGVVTNQTGTVVQYDTIRTPGSDKITLEPKYVHLVDFLIDKKINIQKIYAPEHGFRGTADAGELVKDGKDTKTGIPIISIYGNNKKPSPEQLADIDILVFDIQDIGARFYTYISSLHYVMEACAELHIPLVVLDRPNPNGGIVDGPVLEKENSSFIGMHTIPVLHGMTIGEYAQMINGEKWLKDGIQCDLHIIACSYYKREMPYSLPVKPSPNIPNDQAVNLYASLCFFEGTNVSVGRGTDKQFQIYGSPDLPDDGFSFTPAPNEGSKEPPQNGKLCFGKDLTNVRHVKKLELKWLIKAYEETADKSRFFTSFFTKLAGTKKLQEQIEAGMSESEIKDTWTEGLNAFKEMRKPYLIYGN